MTKRVVLSLILALAGLGVIDCGHPSTNTGGVGGSSSASGGAGGNGGVAATCTTAGEVDCAGICAALTTNAANCGTCGTKCGTGMKCLGSACVCQGTSTSCSGACVDTQIDSTHCGNCTTTCATGQSCSTGACSCGGGQTACSGTCTDTKTDAKNCGTCGTICPTGQACSNGACTCSGAGQTACSGTCTDPQTDANNCGTCGTKCSTGQSCLAGVCQCQSGLTACSGACVDIQSDATHCGGCTNAPCATGQVCSAGTCQTNCGTGLTKCASSCVNVTNSVQNCGVCGTVCATGLTCSSSACTCSGAGQTACSGSCTDTKTDAKNCGTCGTTCPTGQACSNGACSCASGQTACSGTCTNTQTDANNCGTCSTKCPTGTTCTAGTCNCPTGQTLCSGACVDTKTSATNCGTCGTACPGGQGCSAGTCACPNAGESSCNGNCSNWQTDVNNCGACANKCAAGATCTAGACSGGQTTCSDSTYSGSKYVKPYDGSYNATATTKVNAMSNADQLAQMQGIDWNVSTTSQNWNDTFRSANTVNANPAVAGFKFRDGPRGVNLLAPIANASAATGTGFVTQMSNSCGTDSSTITGSCQSTVFPVAMARGASFDLDLEYQIGQASGDEMLAAKQTMILAPTVNILRHPLWGRAQETYGEDVFLLGRAGSAYTVGVQEYVPACAKHYAANNVENGRASFNIAMDEQTLREDYARHFEMIIKDGGVACIMAAYNKVNGTNCTQNSHLLNDILRTDFGFKGFVLSDWWAMPGGSGAQSSGTSFWQTNAAGAVAAGLDMELPWNMNFSVLTPTPSGIRDATSGATVSSAQIKTAATRILEQKLRFKVDSTTGAVGLQTPTTGYSGSNITGNQSHIDLAYKAALEGSVLLKNSSALPIASSVKKVAVIGASIPFTRRQSGATADTTGTINFATDLRTGDWGSSRARPTSGTVGPFAGIQAAAPSGVTVTSGTAASAAAGQDLVVVVAGLTERDEGEEYTGAGDRTTCDLDGKQNTGVQNKLIADVVTQAAGKPVVVILEGGSVINVAPWIGQVQAVVMAWYPGMVGGKALGDLLWGKANFSGKLPITWPASCADMPAFPPSGNVEFDVGYRYFEKNAKTPQFYFGHGLSYTSFVYSNPQTPCSAATKTGVISLNVTVQNTGSVAGDEIVYAFASTSSRPIKELKGFTRATIPAGQTQPVTIQVRAADLKYWNGTAWTVDSGNVDFYIGPSADSTKQLKVTVPIQ